MLGKLPTIIACSWLVPQPGSALSYLVGENLASEADEAWERCPCSPLSLLPLPQDLVCDLECSIVPPSYGGTLLTVQREESSGPIT